jgi:hypothetical protein
MAPIVCESYMEKDGKKCRIFLDAIDGPLKQEYLGCFSGKHS